MSSPDVRRAPICDPRQTYAVPLSGREIKFLLDILAHAVVTGHPKDKNLSPEMLETKTKVIGHIGAKLGLAMMDQTE